ncbi:MAG TPA: proteasome assembly chaperone 4 family protein [Candidatus Lokiarchaeia archaeon]|nr:proteasome assembly chaperone 4 family protein [Candidatus Lokiarchaeia archaeon]
MPLGFIFEYRASADAITFFFDAIKLRNAFLAFITDREDGIPALGNMAITAPTRLGDMPIVSSALPLTNFKYEVLAKAVSEMMGKKLGSAVFVFLDVHFESTNMKIAKALKLSVDEFCKIILKKMNPDTLEEEPED